MKIKKYSRWLILFVILAASARAILFTGQLLLANFFLYRNQEENAAAYLYRLICTRPIVYYSLPKPQEILVNDFILKKAIYTKYRNNRDIFDTFAAAPGVKELTTARFKSLYRDNLYFHSLFPPLPPQAHWENLDTVSLELLADPTWNPLTTHLWEKIKPSVSLEFTANLADYCHWQGNKELADFLAQEALPGDRSFSYPGSPAASESVQKLLKTFRGKNKLTHRLTKKNLEAYPPGSEDFTCSEDFKNKWEFSIQTGNKDPHAASFTIGIDSPGPGENHCLRLMGFFPGGDGDNDSDSKAKTMARGGAVRKKNLPITNGYYLLSFDYLTATGDEKPSFFLCKGLSEVFLPPTNRAWKKAVYFLNNTTGAYPALKPFFRMWGTGTVFIDNIYFAAIHEPSFNFNRTALIYTTGWK